MKKTLLTRAATLLLAVICCLSLAFPITAVTDAKAPLTGITLKAGKETDYKLAPNFQQNTQVYSQPQSRKCDHRSGSSRSDL